MSFMLEAGEPRKRKENLWIEVVLEIYGPPTGNPMATFKNGSFHVMLDACLQTKQLEWDVFFF